MIEFRKIQDFTRKFGSQAALARESFLDWLQYVHADVEREGGNKGILPELFDYDLDRIFHPDQPVKIQYVENGKGTAENFLEFLTREFPGTRWQVEKVAALDSFPADVRTMASRKMPPIEMKAEVAANLDQLVSYMLKPRATTWIRRKRS